MGSGSPSWSARRMAVWGRQSSQCSLLSQQPISASAAEILVLTKSIACSAVESPFATAIWRNVLLKGENRLAETKLARRVCSSVRALGTVRSQQLHLVEFLGPLLAPKSYGPFVRNWSVLFSVNGSTLATHANTFALLVSTGRHSP